MNMWRHSVMKFVAVCCVGLSCMVTAVPAGDQTFVPTVIQVSSQSLHTRNVNHSISIIGNDFVLDGQPLHIRSGSLHYFRVPAAYWRDRLHKLKAAGFNAVCTYVEWSFHEPEERQYSFSGDRDLVAFIRTAAEEGLHVLLRPGPYICAERDLGGFPYWLLGKYPNMRLRTTDPNFMEETRIWLEKLFEKITPLLFGNGGPIILVQVENEYGSFGDDMDYRVRSRDLLRQHVGTNAILFTTDGASKDFFERGYVPETLTTIDFGPTSKRGLQLMFAELRKFTPSGPLMNSEYYPGWLTHWGEQFQTKDTESVVNTMRDMIDLKANFNVYMFFGGTNLEFTSGANYGYTYQPDTTSYDYDAPLSEAGDPTPKYRAIRNLLKQYKFVDENEPEPTPSPKGAYGPVTVTPRVQLLSSAGRASLGKAYPDVHGVKLPTFEELRQRSGLMLYETTLSEGKGMLKITSPRDWCYVYVDGIYQGSINRMYKLFSLPISSQNNSKLSLLVENQGRINYGPRLVDRKGILSSVTYNNETLGNTWSVTGYPLEVFNTGEEQLSDRPDLRKGPALFEGSITLPASTQPLDTFLDTTGWGRGYVWVNGYNLGRYWPGLGPQITLYVPGVYLKAAPTTNKVQILELESAPTEFTMQFLDYPILNRTGFI